MKYYHKNPRQITPHQLEQLGQWLDELGDLSGIVHDLNSDEVISGNQRARVFDINQCETVLTDGPHEPDEQGTVALGYVTWQGKQYGYRQVRWTPERCEQANIVANKAGGEFDFEALKGWDVERLLEWGFKPYELGLEAEEVDYEKMWQGMPEFEQEDLTPHRRIAVYFANDEGVQSFAELIGQEISEKAKWIWHPKQVREDFLISAYQDEP